MKGQVNKLLAMFLIIVLGISSQTCQVFADDKPFAFYLTSTSGSTIFKVYPELYNTKLYADHPATVKVASNNAPGYGYAFRMSYKAGNGYYNATDTSKNYWVSGTGTVYPKYASGQNIVGRNYYVSARIDNDYTGPYSCTGNFNSDRTY